MKKILLLDVDDVICFNVFLSAINEFLGTNYEIDFFKEYYIDKCVIPKERFDEYNRFLSERNLYKDAYPLPGAVEKVKRLDKVFDIHICSSCINPFNIESSGRLYKDKFDFLIRVLSFLNPEKFIFTNYKNLIAGDIIVDDRLSNLGGNREQRILFPAYHNKEISDNELIKNKIVRAGYDWKTGWDEVENILLSDDFDKSTNRGAYTYKR